MAGFFKKGKKEKDGILIVKETKPGMCGGTDATRDTRAPKEILSEKMTLFEVSSALPTLSAFPRDGEPLGYLSAFAAPAEGGTFLFLETGAGFRRRGEKTGCWSVVKADAFPFLTELVREQGLAAQNGFHSTTHGLPENFGGSVEIRYESGETISFSDNQTPILTRETGERIAALFRDLMAGERVSLPEAEDLTGIRFAEIRADGGYTRAALTLLPDGTGLNKKTAQYEGSAVYESEKPVEAAVVTAIRNTIRNCGLTAWAGLPEREYKYGGDKSLTFLFADGTEISVTDDKWLPSRIRGGFFDIELEMTTRH